LNAVIDLSIRNGTERTVLALDALGGADSADSQTALIDALTGTGNGGKLINSSVVSMSHDKAVTLEIEGQRGGDYDGVLGFGDFQKTVEYAEAVSTESAVGAAAEQIAIGNVAHHYGLAGSVGELNVLKKGNSIQSVYSAMLNKLEVQGGYFQADNALVASTLKTKDATHILVGEVGTDHPHSLVVGKNGILSIDSNNADLSAAGVVDAFKNLGAGIPISLKEVISGTSTSIEVVDPSAFVLFEDGAVITAHGNWKTNGTYKASITAGDKSFSSEVPISIDIATGASVTINTHNYTPDATINASNDVFGRYNSSHVIQLLGEMEGHDVHLTFNNELISAAAQKDGSAGSTGSMMGYAAIRDLHQFSGNSSVTVKAMTTLQVNGTSDSSAASADEPAPLYEEQLVVNVQGNQSAIQFTDNLFKNVQEYQVDKVTLKDGGHVLIGGVLKNTTSVEKTTLDMSSVETAVTHRGAETASITNLNMKDYDSGTQVELGGTAAETSVVTNAAVSTTGTATNLKIHQTELHNSVVLLHSACSLDLTEAVLVDKNSAVLGATSSGDIKLPSVAAVAAQGLGEMPTTIKAGETVTVGANTTVELTTSGGTVYTSSNGAQILHVYADQFQNVNVTGTGLTLILADDLWAKAYSMGMEFVAIQVGGSSGQFLFESANNFASGSIGANTKFSLTDSKGRNLNSDWVTSTFVGSKVSGNLLWIQVPEPATTTLSLAALVALCARRRRR
ncbi:MAG: hypothetical protein II295_05760, partial [Akkermansia sp.]|nr:hypothetical protein [Akkermansia sp.]